MNNSAKIQKVRHANRLLNKIEYFGLDKLNAKERRQWNKLEIYAEITDGHLFDIDFSDTSIEESVPVHNNKQCV